MTVPDKIMKFEPQFRANTPELLVQIQQLSLALREYETTSGGRERARKYSDAAKFEMAVEALACNLIVVAATGAASTLAIPRSNGVMWAGGSTPNRVYGAHFLTAIRLMAQLGLIEEGDRGYYFSDTARLASTIVPTVKMNSYLPLSPPDWRAVQQIDDEALILLRTKKRAGKAELKPFAQNKRTQQLARELIRINTVLREAKIEIAGLADNLTLGDDGRIVVPFRRALRRIFNNAKWQHGGRLAGGFWMSMPKGERHRIRIDGEEVREVDYRQLHPRLAYARALHPQPEGDLYDIAGDGTGRDGWLPILDDSLWSNLTFTKELEKGTVGWAQHASLRASLKQIAFEDGKFLETKLTQQASSPQLYKFSGQDKQRLGQKASIRTENRAVLVAVPDASEEGNDTPDSYGDVRESHKIQAAIARIGAFMGFRVWIPKADRHKILGQISEDLHSAFLNLLPLNYDDTTLKTIEQIDVIWMKGRSMSRAFEVEHTTAIYSGLLRMADLLALQPNMDIRLHIVAPEEKRDKVLREIKRPVFSLLDRGPLYESCSYLPYEGVNEIAKMQHLNHMSDTIIEEFEEFAQDE